MDGCPKETIELNLLGFAPSDQVESVCRFAVENGYAVRVLHAQANGGNKVLESVKADKYRVSVLVIGDERPEYADLLQALQGVAMRTCLGIFLGAPRESDTPLLNAIGEFVIWPCEIREFKLRVSRLRRLSENRHPGTEKCASEFNLIGSSAEFDKVLRLIETFQACDAPVLIEGETGTGKEVVARAIHYKSPRRGCPFIPVNCGALPDTLVENELYGHAKGAYTDAKTEQSGFVGQAEGGTLFLDEIEALSTKAQVSLLRFLQEYQYRPLGKDKMLKANVRIIAASNVEVQRLVEAGQLRQDLYFRLNILHINLPSLRERPADILELVEYFLDQYCRQYKVGRKRLHPDVYSVLLDYDWPGNVREVENSVHRAVLMTPGEVLTAAEFNLDTAGLTSEANVETDTSNLHTLAFNAAKLRVIEDFEKRYLHRVMKETQGNVSLAARHACKERRALGKLLKKYGIDRNDFIR
ncbi:MAG TPA: sigma-54 dependent transcriptional regulator [Gammaproteobacteria bacterium]